MFGSRRTGLRARFAIGLAVVVAALGSVGVGDAGSVTGVSYLFGRVTLSAPWGPPGTAQTILMSNFLPAESVTVSYKTGANPATIVLCATTASTVGRAVCNANIPTAGKTGNRIVEARGATSSIVGRATFVLTPPVPSDVVAVGDDLTAGTRATSPGEQPEESWATGTDSAVRSAVTRLGELSPAITTHNLAQTGAKAADLASQLSDPAAQGADLLTFEIGFNDLCAPSLATMTDASTFDTTVKQALASYRAANPNTLILALSLPSFGAIRASLRNVAGVQATWDSTAVCPALLASTNTNADLVTFGARENAFSDSIRNACAAIARCTYDGGALAQSVPGSPSMLSTVDDFHPSAFGQAQIAFLAMHTSPWAPLGGRITTTPSPNSLGDQRTLHLDDAMPNVYVTDASGCEGMTDATGSFSCTYSSTSVVNGSNALLIEMRVPPETGIGSAIILTSGSSVTTPPLPKSMASAGDSITQARNVGACCAGIDNPQYSWSTGTNPAVASHFRKLAAMQPTITEQNVSVSGAKIADLQNELGHISPAPLDYLTILIGANDVCTPSLATMTDPTVFETTFRNAINAFRTAHPETWILVSSIPNIYKLWSVLHTNASAVATWSSVGLCQSMLSTTNTETNRHTVLVREEAFNAKLAKVCNATSHCKWDRLAGFNFKFTASDVSTVDYFHPSLIGQNHASAASWAAGYWPAW